MEKKYNAIICGHTGATGKFVLDELVDAPWINIVITIGRSEYPKYKNHPKVKQIITPDLTDLSHLNPDEFEKIDFAFDLVATPVSEAFKGEEVYRIADVEMTSEFARFAKSTGATFLSAIGMVPMKGTDYASKAKKDFEDYARTLGFERLAFMHPKWVNRESDTKWYESFYTLFGLIGTKASHISRTLVWAAKNQTEADKDYSIKEIKSIATTGNY